MNSFSASLTSKLRDYLVSFQNALKLKPVEHWQSQIQRLTLTANEVPPICERGRFPANGVKIADNIKDQFL
jgi:hypothetical protein